MNFGITVEWDVQCGIQTSKIFPVLDGLKNAFANKEYGSSVSEIFAVMICRGRDFKQRKRFKKEIKLLEYDILLDFFLIKHAEMEQKKEIIRRQMIEITEQTFSNYKFIDFDKSAFISDFKTIINSIEW